MFWSESWIGVATMQANQISSRLASTHLSTSQSADNRKNLHLPTPTFTSHGNMTGACMQKNREQ